MTITVHNFSLRSLSPLLMNNPESMKGGSQALGAKKIPSPEDEAAAKVYKLKNGNLCLHSNMFRASLLAGCVGKRIGKTGAATMVAAGVFCVNEETPLFSHKGKPIKEYEIHKHRAVVQKQGVNRARPLIREWKAEVAFEIDDDFITLEQVREIFGFAGRIAGVGDWRPNKKGSMGRYMLE